MSERPRNLPAIRKAVDFLNGIGLSAALVAFPKDDGEFLPGILVSAGRLLIDRARILGYDDIFHEAGHLAVLPSIIRKHAYGDIEQSTIKRVQAYLDTHQFTDDRGTEDPIVRALLQSGEDEASAWSYAAQVACGLKPRLRFAIMENLNWRNATRSEISVTLLVLSRGNHFGVHGLEAAGMTKARNFFPQMLRWVQP